MRRRLWRWVYEATGSDEAARQALRLILTMLAVIAGGVVLTVAVVWLVP